MNKTVLIVDDDELIRDSLGRVLRDKGLSVQLATNGKDGLKKALAGGVDMVVTDVIMPEMDGLKMLTKLREDPDGREIPAIILSNDEETETVNEAMQAGVTVYLSKTFQSADELAEQIVVGLGIVE